MAAAPAPLGGRALLASLMLLVTVASAFPLVWMVLSSLKTTAETMQVPPVWLPRTPNLDAYEKVAGVVNVGRSMWNSLVIASVTTAGILAHQHDGRLCLRQIPVPRPHGCCSRC